MGPATLPPGASAEEPPLAYNDQLAASAGAAELLGGICETDSQLAHRLWTQTMA